MARRYRLRKEQLDLLIHLYPLVAHKAAAGPCVHDNHSSRAYWTDLHKMLRAALLRAGLEEWAGYEPNWEYPSGEESP